MYQGSSGGYFEMRVARNASENMCGTPAHGLKQCAGLLMLPKVLGRAWAAPKPGPRALRARAEKSTLKILPKLPIVFGILQYIWGTKKKCLALVAALSLAIVESAAAASTNLRLLLLLLPPLHLLLLLLLLRRWWRLLP